MKTEAILEAELSKYVHLDLAPSEQLARIVIS